MWIKVGDDMWKCSWVMRDLPSGKTNKLLNEHTCQVNIILASNKDMDTQTVVNTQIAKFMGPTWGPPGTCRPQMGPILAPRTLLSGTTSPLVEVVIDVTPANKVQQFCMESLLGRLYICWNIKVPRHWPLWGEFTGNRRFHLMTSSWFTCFFGNQTLRLERAGADHSIHQ